MGLMRMHKLAKQCSKLQIFCHVSTAFVNCDKKGYIQEKMYEEVTPDEAE